MPIRGVGIDLAKNVYQLHGVDRFSKTIWKRRLKRHQWFKVLLEKTEPGCVIGMEACASAHHWGRELQSRSYTVKLIPPLWWPQREMPGSIARVGRWLLA